MNYPRIISWILILNYHYFYQRQNSRILLHLFNSWYTCSKNLWLNLWINLWLIHGNSCSKPRAKRDNFIFMFILVRQIAVYLNPNLRYIMCLIGKLGHRAPTYQCRRESRRPLLAGASYIWTRVISPSRAYVIFSPSVFFVSCFTFAFESIDNQ